jgi:hypothetical protein
MIATARHSLHAVGLCALLLATGLTSPPAGAQQRVGVNSAVNPEATGIPPSASPRRLVLGQEIVFKERVTTASEGQTQILFLDQSSMTVGPNSDMLIDEFVYDPSAGTGKMAASLTRGVFRFVGGKLSKQESAITMQTPSATIGIRGAVALLNLSANGKLQVICAALCKGITVTGLNGVSKTITAPGFEVTVSGLGAAPSDPAPAPPGAAAALLTQLDGRPGGSGGARTIPTETMVASSGIGQAVQQSPLPVGVQTTTQVQQQQPPNVNQAVALAQTQIQVTATQPTVQQSEVEVRTPVSPPPPTPPTPPTPPPPTPPTPPTPPPPTPPVGVTFAGIFKSTNGSGTALGFVGQSAPARIPFTNATLLNGILTVSLSAAGQLTIPLVPGTATFGPSGTASPLGPVSGSSYLSADSTFFYAYLTPVNAPMQREFVAGGMPVTAGSLASAPIVAFTVQPDAALQSNIPFIRNNAGGNLANAFVSPLFIAPQTTTALQASLAINGQGANQQSVLVTAIGSVSNSGPPAISGVVRGSSQLSAASTPVRIGSNLTSVADGMGNSLYGTSAISGFTLDQTQASLASEVPLSGAPTNYGFTQPATPTSLPSGFSTSRTTQTQAGYFGGVMNTTATAQPYAIAGTTALSTDAGPNRVTATFTTDPAIASATGGPGQMQFGGTTGNSAFINDAVYGAAEGQSNAQLYLLSSGAAPPPSSLLQGTGASYCQCQYLQWGYWGGDITSPSGSSMPRIDRGGINFWVAGPVTPLADINTLAMQSARGDYTGHMIGSVFNNGQQYVAAGGVAATYFFATQTGSFSVMNYDGKSFTATGNPTVQGASYRFVVDNPQGIPIKGGINGSFYGPLAANTGGNFAFQSTAGPTYLTSGVFAAKR